MHFQPEDELAVHTVAAAVYGLLKGIKNSRGMNEAADAHLVSIFYVVRDYRRGTLPAHLTRDGEFMDEVRRIAEELSPITADTQLCDVRVTLGPELERQYWNNANRAANFLKHADRRDEPSLDAEIIDNRLLLLKCFSAYQDVAPDDLGNEGLVFQAFIGAENESFEKQDGNSFASIIASLRKVPAHERGQLCYKVIIEMNSRQ